MFGAFIFGQYLILQYQYCSMPISHPCLGKCTEYHW